MTQVTNSFGGKDVVGYFQHLGVRPSKEFRQFVQELERRHGRNTACEIARLMEDRANGQAAADLYVAKNESLALSLDFARFSADLYRRFFEWFVTQSFPHVRTIVDVGCDNGFATCFYAIVYPMARVVGVDICHEGIECAKALAHKLQLTNVEFIQGDFVSDNLLHGLLGKVDLVLSLRSLHEIAGNVNDVRYWSIADLRNRLEADVGMEHASLHVLKRIDTLLSPLGCFVSCERLTHAGSIYAWAWMLECAGLPVDWSSAKWLAFHETGMNQRMPILLSRRGCAENSQTEDLYQYLMQNQSSSPVPGQVSQDDEAAMIFEQMKEKSLIEGVEVTYPDGASSERMELWTSPQGLLRYHRTDIGFRELEFLPADSLESERRNLLNWLTQIDVSGIARHYT